MSNSSVMTPKHHYLDKIRMEARERRRNILHLILAYLRDNALGNSAEMLLKEGQLDDGFKVCENVELDVIVQEYQSYYYTKFQKYPKLVRKLDESEKKIICKGGGSAKKGKENKCQSPSEGTSSEQLFQFDIVSLNSKPMLVEQEHQEDGNIKEIDNTDIIIRNISVKWHECLGLESPIEILKEAAVYPLLYPDIFGGVTPWKGVLLHGPPGTGKTLLAKALASEAQTTFFNVTSSTFISKWRGDSEKMIKRLFDLAKLHAPSTIFFDELDSLICNSAQQHEASKRFRSELLVQLDGISSTNQGQMVIVASTNCPWDLDAAVLRRFDKRVLVDMPLDEARKNILQHHLKGVPIKLSQDELNRIAEMTENYSGCDIKSVSKEVGMALVRERIKLMKDGDRKKTDRAATFDDVKTALQKVKPSGSGTVCKRYYQWQNEYGAY